MMAALDLIAEEGIAGTSTRMITARAELTRGVLHYHFQSKDRLLVRVLDALFRNFITNAEQIVESDLLPEEKLDQVLTSGASLVGPRRKEFIALMAFWAHAIATGGDLLELYKERHKEYEDVLARILGGEGRDGKTLPVEEQRRFARLVMAGVEGFGLQFALRPERFDSAEWGELTAPLRAYLASRLIPRWMRLERQ